MSEHAPLRRPRPALGPAGQRLALLGGAGIPGARWVPPENYHLTLRFIGEVACLPGRGGGRRAGQYPRPALHAVAGRLGTFEKGGRITALWVGVEKNPQLDLLQTRSRPRCSASGWSRSASASPRT